MARWPYGRLQRPGDRVTVRNITPPVYQLPPGLNHGDIVTLKTFTPGYWEVETDDKRTFTISIVLVDELITPIAS